MSTCESQSKVIGSHMNNILTKPCGEFKRILVFVLQQIQDRFWNFIFYKFIFIFGVLNVQKFNEVMWWTAWFTLLGFFHLFTQLCKDRFEYVSHQCLALIVSCLNYAGYGSLIEGNFVSHTLRYHIEIIEKFLFIFRLLFCLFLFFSCQNQYIGLQRKGSWCEQRVI